MSEPTEAELGRLSRFTYRRASMVGLSVLVLLLVTSLVPVGTAELLLFIGLWVAAVVKILR